jgi:tetratricopeptide (TPR) repeat protein
VYETGFRVRSNSSSGVAWFHNFLAAVVCLPSISVAHADSSSQVLIKAIKTWDVGALQAQAAQASDIGRQGLARAVLKAFSGADDVAIDLLEELIASRQLDDELRFAAFNELGILHLRNQRYLQAAGAFESALRFSGSAATDETEEIKDSLKYARAFGAVAPMTVAVVSRKASLVIRDAMDLPRVSTEINGHQVDAIMDTGATNSVVSVSTAKRLHLRMVRFGRGG